MTTTEHQIEQDLIAKLGELKYTYRPDIRDRGALETNFRAKFEALNRVRLNVTFITAATLVVREVPMATRYSLPVTDRSESITRTTMSLELVTTIPPGKMTLFNRTEAVCFSSNN